MDLQSLWITWQFLAQPESTYCQKRLQYACLIPWWDTFNFEWHIIYMKSQKYCLCGTFRHIAISGTCINYLPRHVQKCKKIDHSTYYMYLYVTPYQTILAYMPKCPVLWQQIWVKPFAWQILLIQVQICTPSFSLSFSRVQKFFACAFLPLWDEWPIQGISL